MVIAEEHLAVMRTTVLVRPLLIDGLRLAQNSCSRKLNLHRLIFLIEWSNHFEY